MTRRPLEEIDQIEIGRIAADIERGYKQHLADQHPRRRYSDFLADRGEPLNFFRALGCEGLHSMRDC